LVENRVVLAVEESRAAAILFAKPRQESGNGHVLIAPPGAGNIGDQAMVEAFVANVDGPVTVVVRRDGDVSEMPADLQERVTELVLPGLLYGLPHEHLRAMTLLAPVLARSRSLSVIGADIMDGAYWESPSVRRFRLARLASMMGLDTRVIGFSWNASPSRAARRAMVAASSKTDLLVRDPLSAERLRTDGAVRTVSVADIALLTRPRPIDEELDRWITRRREEGRRVVLLNANGLIEATTGMVNTYANLVGSRFADDCAFIAVPHVSRGTPTDVDLARMLEERIGDRDRVIAIDRLLSPGQIASLADRADLAVTGRMHLTVLSTSVGTPVVTVGYQGKVAGLYALIGTDMSIESGPVAREGLLPLVEKALASLPELREAVSAARPAMIELARRNVAGLGRTS
jgi:polysaccharide pyruvyl transferase WcaK-like protein